LRFRRPPPKATPPLPLLAVCCSTAVRTSSSGARRHPSPPGGWRPPRPATAMALSLRAHRHARGRALLLTDKRRIPLRSASVRTPHLFHHGIPKVLVNPRSKGITSVRSTTTH
jgi:hypothetical protein